METSFPSKLLQYAQFGKPLVIWGPEYCSAIEWGLHGDRAICVTKALPNAIVSKLSELKQNPAQYLHYAQQAHLAAANEFNPKILQQQFLQAIADINRS